MTSQSDPKRGSSSRIPIIVALIGCAATISAACIVAIFGPMLLKKLNSPTPTSTPAVSSIPTISILGYPTDTNFAPYDVVISGIASNADGKYLYLIVVDAGGVKWVQPPLGRITGDKFSFSGHAFLGAGDDDPGAQNKTFTIYVVVSDNPSYKRNDHPTNEPMLVTSDPINLVRGDRPTPTP
jgi:hypothetical protein